jgi:hypothetical protein
MGLSRAVVVAAVVLALLKPGFYRAVWELVRSKYINRMENKFLSHAGVALGNITTMIEHKDRIHFWYTDVTKQLGQTWVSVNPFWDFDCVLITSPDNVQHILKDNAKNFGKGDKFMAIFRDLLGDGIFNSNGPNWELQRKISAKIFTGNNFRQFFENVFVDHAAIATDLLLGHAKSGEIIDAQQLMFDFTMDGIKINPQENSDEILFLTLFCPSSVLSRHWSNRLRSKVWQPRGFQVGRGQVWEIL